MIATRGFLTAVECTKSVFGRGSAPDPAGGAHDALPDPLVGWGGGGGTPSPFPTPLDAFGVSISSPAAPRSQNRLRIFFLDTALPTGALPLVQICPGMWVSRPGLGLETDQDHFFEVLVLVLVSDSLVLITSLDLPLGFKLHDIWLVDSQENHKKLLPPDVRF